MQWHDWSGTLANLFHIVAKHIIGMMMELGPCLVNEYGNGTENNLHSWTKNSSMIFIDQPAGTGFSYTDLNVDIPGDSFVGASDMYIFLQIFLTQVFPQMRELPFHISGESYGVYHVLRVNVRN